MSIYEYTIKSGKGEDVALSDFKGKVMMIVNTATGCGFTPQYEAIEKMYEKYHDQGFEVIDIPCNQFAGQAPETDEEIHQFCTLKYNTQFPQMKKSEVNGENELPLYTYLKSQQGFKGFGMGPMALAMGAMLKKIGELAREDVEAFMGTKVYLQTWVKVKENWRDSNAQLRNFGFTEQ